MLRARASWVDGNGVGREYIDVEELGARYAVFWGKWLNRGSGASVLVESFLDWRGGKEEVILTRLKA